jgi:hypothetical protein
MGLETCRPTVWHHGTEPPWTNLPPKKHFHVKIEKIRYFQIFIFLPRILILSKSFYFANVCTIYLFIITLKCTLKLLLHVSLLKTMQSDSHSAQCTLHSHSAQCTLHSHSAQCTLHSHSAQCTLHSHSSQCTLHLLTQYAAKSPNGPRRRILIDCF